MEDPILKKYIKQYSKEFSESSLISFAKLPDICENYKEYLLKFYEIIGKYKSNNTIDQNKCLKNAKKIENSTVYKYLLENCLIHKFKEIEKKYKNYPKQSKKIIAIMKKIMKHLIKKDGDKEEKVKENINKIKETIKKMKKENEKLTIFFKKNKKALDELKKDKKKYITFFTVRYILGCFILP
jgi:hypothetical protein